MTLPFTSVVSYHTDPMTCGVAKFSKLLAEKLGVPFSGIGERAKWGQHPLFSLKWSEFTDDASVAWFKMSLQDWPAFGYSMFWHDVGDQSVIGNVAQRASRVFYADPSLGSPGLWCPSMIPVTPRPVKLFSFGMSHKMQTQHYAKVKRLLDEAGKDYRLRVSVGLHEGTSLSDATKHFDALKEIMGADKVTILGCLSDEAVSEELHNADYVLAFFENGLRANNTTVHAARAHNRIVLTNLDSDSPRLLSDVYDIRAYPWWPKVLAPTEYSWERLISEMESHICAVSK